MTVKLDDDELDENHKISFTGRHNFILTVYLDPGRHNKNNGL